MNKPASRRALDDLFDVIFLDRVLRSARFNLTPTAVRQLEVFGSAFHRSEPSALTETISAPAQADDWRTWQTNKMKFSRTDRSEIQFNDFIELSAFPEQAYTFKVGQLTPVEWVIDRCQVTWDPRSGRILFNPNDFSRRHGCPRLIADFLATTIAASCSAARH